LSLLMLSLNLGGATDRLSLLVAFRSEFTCFTVKTYLIKLLRSIMAEPMKDPLLGLVLTKLTAIEVSINELSHRVGIQNGRVSKLESVNESERAVSEQIRVDSAWRARRLIAFVAAGVTLLAAVMAEIVSRV
jgi:hypothetical protein